MIFAMSVLGIGRAAPQPRGGNEDMARYIAPCADAGKPMAEQRAAGALAGMMAASLKEATGAGYRLGYEIARDEAAFLALEAGRPDLADRIRALRPAPGRTDRVA